MKPFISEIETSTLANRLDELSDAACGPRDKLLSEFTMTVPPKPERDADLVLSAAAIRLREQAAIICSVKRDKFANRLDNFIKALASSPMDNGTSFDTIIINQADIRAQALAAFGHEDI